MDALLALVWGAACAVCGQTLAAPTRGPVCEACWQAVPSQIGRSCSRCGTLVKGFAPCPPTDPSPADSLCGPCAIGASTAPLDRQRSAGCYDGTLRLIVHALKYHGHRSVAPRLSRRLLHAGTDLLPDSDVVVAVPLHVAKRWRRGFNQADLLSRALPVRRLIALRRTRNAASQTGLSADERRRQVSHAFDASRRLRLATWLARSPAGAAWIPRGLRRLLIERWSVARKSVLLVDDVVTTGATLDACARVLLRYGARRVSALTVARVERQ